MSLGLAESYSANAVADVISVFRSKYPDVRFDLFTATADLVLERIDKALWTSVFFWSLSTLKNMTLCGLSRRRG